MSVALQKQYVECLEQAYERWDQIKEKGGNDLFYTDGHSLNLIRRQIICLRDGLKRLCGKKTEQYPEVYFREIPPEIDAGFMASADEIRTAAQQSLIAYQSDANFDYLSDRTNLVSARDSMGFGMRMYLGIIPHLACAIKEDDLVAMRRLSRQGYYQQGVRRCADNIKKILMEE